MPFEPESPPPSMSELYKPVQWPSSNSLCGEDWSKPIIDEKGRPSELLCRVVDSIFNYANENPTFGNTGLMEIRKLQWLASEFGEPKCESLVTTYPTILPPLWKALGISYNMNHDKLSDRNIYSLDRAAYLQDTIFGIMASSDSAYESFATVIQRCNLRDPKTGCFFLRSFDRSAFPSQPDQSILSVYQKWGEQLRSLMLQHFRDVEKWSASRIMLFRSAQAVDRIRERYFKNSTSS